MTYSILIVDTSATARALVKRALRLTEFGSARVYEADTGREVMDVLEQRRVDVVLIDPRLPDTDGHDLIGRIVAEPDTRGTPVVVMTDGRPDPRRPDPRRPTVLGRLGVRAALRKPVAVDQLREILARVLEPTHV